jgi:hypothetical protein
MIINMLLLRSGIRMIKLTKKKLLLFLFGTVRKIRKLAYHLIRQSTNCKIPKPDKMYSFTR